MADLSGAGNILCDIVGDSDTYHGDQHHQARYFLRITSWPSRANVFGASAEAATTTSTWGLLSNVAMSLVLVTAMRSAGIRGFIPQLALMKAPQLLKKRLGCL